MHDLIRNYRETRNIVLDMESKLILQVAPNKLYDSLPAIHKLEVDCIGHLCAVTLRDKYLFLLLLRSSRMR